MNCANEHLDKDFIDRDVCEVAIMDFLDNWNGMLDTEFSQSGHDGNKLQLTDYLNSSFTLNHLICLLPENNIEML